MSSLTGLSAALAFATAFLQGDAKDSKRIPLTVHEWGTFTFVQGSDGVTLEGLSHDEWDLPSFVARRETAERSNNRTKMETPVTYFYTPKEQDVRVSVDFPGGVFTHWYPNVRAFAPALPEEKSAAAAAEAAAPAGGTLEWGLVKLIPAAQHREPLPDVEGKTHYAHAREVDAAVVRMCGPVEQHERFLFYRGLGSLDVPLKTKLESCESPDSIHTTLEITNPASHPIEHVYVLVVKNGRASFHYLRSLRAAETTSVSLGVDGASKKLETFVDDLQKHLASSLALLGLYEKEAWAMVRTWTESYFRNEGVRVLCALPKALTDRVLPLRVEPTPDATVRVMIARIECVTVGQERTVTDAIKALESPDPAVVKAAGARIQAMGRIAEPILRRAIECCGEAKRPELVKALLRPFHPER